MRSHTQRLMVCAASFAALCMGLAGCGSNTASTGGDSGEVVNLTYMHRLPDSEGMTLVKDIVAKWNKDHPNIQVKATKFDGAAQDMIKSWKPTSRPAMLRILHRSATPKCLRCSPRACSKT